MITFLNYINEIDKSDDCYITEDRTLQCIYHYNSFSRIGPFGRGVGSMCFGIFMVSVISFKMGRCTCHKLSNIQVEDAIWYTKLEI